MNELDDELNFGDLLKNWPNDDILFTEDARALVKVRNPDLFPIFDWPEIRDEFTKHDKPALKAKALNVKSGRLTLIFSFLGLSISALSTVNLNYESQIRSIAEIFLLLGILCGLWHLWRSRHKKTWLGHRFWTERLRQFYFQFLINNAEIAARASKDSKVLEEYLDKRKLSLSQLLSQKPKTAILLEQTIDDLAETSPWLVLQWENEQTIDEKTPNLQKILDITGRQRIGIQKEYVTRVMKSGFKSPIKRQKIFEDIISFATIGMVILSAIAGIVMLTTFDFSNINEFWSPNKHEIGSGPVRAMFCFAAILGVVVAMVKAIDQSLSISASAERYKWYSASVSELETRFSNAQSSKEKVRLLRELERLSYQEMRRFLHSNMKAKFGV
jgi:hypothetical protein